MHPAYSVIFFTVASGAGFGLLGVVAAGALIGWWQPVHSDTAVMPALILGTVLAVAGLLSSTFHLGQPTRAWRAFSQWRSSWLSREGVLAVAGFIPVAGLFLAWWLPNQFASWLFPLACATVLLMLATVFCTAMIYASLKTIPRWHQPLVAPVYLAMAVASGSLLMLLFVPHRTTGALVAIVITLACAWLIKALYWRAIDSADAVSTAESATGLGDLGKVSVLDPPHTSANYVQKEMGFAIARKHAAKLRKLALVFGLIIPILLVFFSIFLAGITVTFLVLLAALSLFTGLLIERWLFFAEAEHVVTLFYGATSV